MELKEFVKKAIYDITEAVNELQGELRNGAIINPSSQTPIPNTTIIDPNEDTVYKRVSNINFDVALTVSDTSTVEGRGNVGIQIVAAKIGSENTTLSENVSRITFSIPIVLPAARIKTTQELLKDNKPKRPAYT